MTPEETAKKIFGDRAEKYTTSAAHTDPQVLSRIVELAAPQAGWKALDIATGAGHTAFALAPHLASVIAIDLTLEMLREAEKLRDTREITNVQFCEGDVHLLPFTDGSFDLITCRRAAHHFSDIQKAMGEMKRVLRSGGRLVIDDRSVPEDDFIDQCMNELDRYHDESHVRQYRPSEWERLLAKAGFALETVEPYVKHRPLTSLTAGAGEENIGKILARLDRLDEEQRRALNLIEVNGETFINHWYLLLSAHNPA